jgi:hypothetical protein
LSTTLSSFQDHEQERRKRSGADRWDEVWEGELHMAACPTPSQIDVEHHLAMWLDRFWAAPRKARVRGINNLAKTGAGRDWVHDFRIPDIVMMERDRFSIIKQTHLVTVHPTPSSCGVARFWRWASMA